MKFSKKNTVPQWSSQWMIYVILMIFLSLGLVRMAQGDTYGLVDEPEMFSTDGQLSNVESLRVEVELDGKKQILAGQQALGFLILRSYVVHDKTKKSGFRTTDKYKAWKKSLPPPPPPPPPINPITNLTGNWSAGRGQPWHISQNGIALTVSHKGRPTFSGRFTSKNTIDVKFTDDQGCCPANVEKSGNTLNWSNQTTWTRIH